MGCCNSSSHNTEPKAGPDPGTRPLPKPKPAQPTTTAAIIQTQTNTTTTAQNISIHVKSPAASTSSGSAGSSTSTSVTTSTTTKTLLVRPPTTIGPPAQQIVATTSPLPSATNSAAANASNANGTTKRVSISGSAAAPVSTSAFTFTLPSGSAPPQAQVTPSSSSAPPSAQQKRWAALWAVLCTDSGVLTDSAVRLVIEYLQPPLVFYTHVEYELDRTQLVGVDMLQALVASNFHPLVLAEWTRSGDLSPDFPSSQPPPQEQKALSLSIPSPPGVILNGATVGGALQNSARITALQRVLWIVQANALWTVAPFSASPALKYVQPCDDRMHLRDGECFLLWYLFEVSCKLTLNSVCTAEYSLTSVTATFKSAAGGASPERRPCLVVTGGCQRTENATTYLQDVDRFDVTERVWTAGEAMAEPRASHASVVLEERFVYVMGGTNSEGILSSAGRYDPVDDVWTQISDMSEPRYGHAACVVTDFPGHTGPLLTLSAVGPTGPLPSPRSGDSRRNSAQTPFAPVHCIVVSGGISGGISKNSCELYDPRTDSWRALPFLNARLYNHSMTCIDRKLFVIGSQLVPGVEQQVPVIECFDPHAATQEWVPLSAAVPGRVFATTFN
jgi:hypothetical protein